MASSFLPYGGNTVRLLQHTRCSLHPSSCHSGGNSCGTITSRARKRDQSLPLFSPTPSRYAENTQQRFIHHASFGSRIADYNKSQVEKQAKNIPPGNTRMTRKLNTSSNRLATNDQSQSSLSKRIFSGYQNNCKSNNFLMEAILATAATGTYMYSSLPKKPSMTEAANKTSTVATSAVASTLLPELNVDLKKTNFFGTAVRDAVASYQAMKTDDNKDLEHGKTTFPTRTNSNRSRKIDLHELEGYIEKKPYFVSVKALRGGRLHMEDEYYIGNGGRFAAVFDGHGGNDVSAALRDRLYPKLNYYEKIEYEKEFNRIGKDATSSSVKRPMSIASWTKAIKNAFDEMDREILMDEKMCSQGSTAVAVFLHDGEHGERTLISANIGDSRAILSRRHRALDLTRDHKPNEKDEKARIIEMGEEVLWDHYSKVYRVLGLSLSRAIGDKAAKPAVSGEVEIKSFPLLSGDEDEFVVLASDGLWDVMSSQDVVNFVHKTLEAPFKGKVQLSQLSQNDRIRLETERRRKMGRTLASKAYTLGSLDNICVIVIWLNQAQGSSIGKSASI